MEKLHMTALSGVITLALGTGVVAENLSKDDYKAATDRIETTYRADKRRCDSMSGNAKDICNAEAAGREKVAKAELEARHNPIPELRHEARLVKAETDYETAKQRCDDRTGNMKEACLKEARTARAAAEAAAAAELQQLASDPPPGGDESLANYGGAVPEKSDAGYQQERQKCMDFEGPARTRCLDRARAQHGR